MLSEVIHSRHSYSAVLLAKQPIDQRSVHPGPLVLGTDLLKYRAPTVDRRPTCLAQIKFRLTSPKAVNVNFYYF